MCINCAGENSPSLLMLLCICRSIHVIGFLHDYSIGIDCNQEVQKLES
jgi:hypothetical protein